jgi:signal transduction histidine kinase
MMRKISGSCVLIFLILSVFCAKISLADTISPRDVAIIEILGKKVDEYKAQSIDSAIKYQKIALHIASYTSRNPYLLFRLNAGLGELFRLKADFSSALQADIRSLRMAEILKDSKWSGVAYNAVGVDYLRMGRLKDAEEYMKTALLKRMEARDSSGMADSYYNLATIYDESGNDVMALAMYSEAMKLFGMLKKCDGIADVYNGLAGFHYMRYKFDSALIYLDKAISVYENCGNPEAMSFLSINMGGLLNSLGKHKDALHYIRKGIETAETIGALSQLRRGYKNLAETYAISGDYKNAWEARLKYDFYKDSIFGLEKTAAFEEIMQKYQAEKKQSVIDRQADELLIKSLVTKQSLNQRNWLIGITILILIMLLLLHFRYREKKRMAQLLDLQKSELERMNAAKDRFFTVISHDLRSPVSSFSKIASALHDSMDIIDRKKMADYLEELKKSSESIHKLLLNLLQWAKAQSGGITPHITSCNLSEIIIDVAGSLNALSSEKQITLSLPEHNDAVAETDSDILATALRNILTNALRFSPEGSEIIIEIKKSENNFEIEISDQGPGMSPDEITRLFRIEEDVMSIGRGNQAKGAGLGLIISSELIKLIAGNIRFEIRDRTGITAVVSLPNLNRHE